MPLKRVPNSMCLKSLPFLYGDNESDWEEFEQRSPTPEQVEFNERRRAFFFIGDKPLRYNHVEDESEDESDSETDDDNGIEVDIQDVSPKFYFSSDESDSENTLPDDLPAPCNAARADPVALLVGAPRVPLEMENPCRLRLKVANISARMNRLMQVQNGAEAPDKAPADTSAGNKSSKRKNEKKPNGTEAKRKS